MSKTIKNLYDYFSGFAFKSIDFSNDGIPLIRIGDINNSEIQFSENTAFLPDFFSEKYKRFLVQKGDVLIGLSGASLGKFGIYKQERKALVNQRILVIREKEESASSSQYLAYYLNILQKGIENKAVGGAQPNISPEKILKFEVKHDLDEQLKIVGRLNRIQQIIDKRLETIQLLDEYINSVFLEMFLEKSSRWEYVSLKESKGIKNRIQGIGRKSNSNGIGKPMLRMNNLSNSGEIILDSLKWIKLSDKEEETFYLENRNVLFNRTNSPELVGKIAVWDKGPGYTFAGYLIRLDLDEDILNPYYLTGYLNTSFGKKVLKNKARLSGNLANISGSKLLELLILLPPIELQNEFERIFIKFQEQKSKLENQQEILKILFQSYLQDAFSQENQIDEDEIFESLLQNFTKEDLKQGGRLKHLLKWIDCREPRFSQFESYDLAWDRLRELLEDGSIEQVLDKNEIKLKVVE